MSPAHEEWQATLSVLTVREDEATIRDFRCDCRGETTCRAELGELLQLLERRRADIAVFFSHPHLVRSLIEQLQQRGKHVPEMVIAPAAGGADARLTVSVSLSGLSASAHPQEILSRLYEALRSAQAIAGGEDLVEAPARPRPQGVAGEPDRQAEGSDSRAGIGPPDSLPQDEAETALFDADTGPQRDEASRLAEPPPGPAAPETRVTVEIAPTDRARSDEFDELSAKLERILNQRLRQTSPP